jgi:hypothetical protein
MFNLLIVPECDPQCRYDKMLDHNNSISDKSGSSSPVINGTLLSQALNFGPDSWIPHEWVSRSKRVADEADICLNVECKQAPANQAPDLSAASSDVQRTLDRSPSSIRTQDHHGSVRSGSLAQVSIEQSSIE